jgi:purine-binding chemotaxis protein CheW
MSALHVLFKVAGAEYAIPATDVLHMDEYGGATPVPGAPAYVAGLVQVRGRVVPVVDLRARFGLPAAPAREGRVVVVKSGARVVGLLVDSAREVVNIAPEALRPPPDLIAGEGGAFVSSIAQTGDRLLMLIDFKKVIGEEQTHGDQ